MPSDSSPQQGSVVENRKDEIRETAASVPVGMEGAIARRKAEKSTATVHPTVQPPTICPPATGPGHYVSPPDAGSTIERSAVASDVLVCSSVEDLVDAHDN